MERLIRLVLLIVAVGLTVQTARPHFRYGDWLDASSMLEILGVSLPLGMGSIVVLLHVGKVMLPAVGAMFWRRENYFCGTLAFLLFSLLVAVSITGMLGILDLQRGERAASAATKVKREADLRAELAATEARLKTIGWWRAAAVVEGEIADERRSPLWSSTDGCSDATTRLQRRYCGALDRLGGELAAAKEAEDDRRREKQIRAELLGMAATSSSAHPDLDFLSRALEISLERAGFWRTVLFAAAIEAAEALFLLFGSMPVRNDTQGRRAGGIRASAAADHVRDEQVSSHSHGEAPSMPSRTSGPVSTPRPTAGASSEGALTCGGTCAQAVSTSRRDVDTEPPPPHEAVAMAAYEAVAAFVAQLPKEPRARATGSALLAAYNARRLAHGWPPLPSSLFGRHLKTAVEAAGGRKVKSNAQVYVGVTLPV